MDFVKMAETCKVPVGSFGIKDKGSIASLSDYYINFYNVLIEKFKLKCEETKYIHTEKSADGTQAIEFNWFSYKELDNFARLRFDCINNAFNVKGDKIMGIFTIKYTLELDYKRQWRDSIFKSFLPYYLKMFYQNVILQWFERYVSELNSIKDEMRKMLNVSVFE